MTVIVTNVKKVVDFLTLAASLLAATGLAMIVCSYIYEVVSRYVFQSPTAWASDFVAYALCASAFLALPHVTKDKAHVAVTILVDIAPKTHRQHFACHHQHLRFLMPLFRCLG